MNPSPSDADDVVAAATRLADLLARENAALAALAFAQATDIAAGKERVIAAFSRAIAAEALPLHLARRLAGLAAENKRLLERAIYVQGQVIACIARAAPRPAGVARGYGRTGAWAAQGRTTPIALAARI
jgi:hypothetical protein